MQKTIYIQKIFLLIVVTFSYSIAMAQQFKSPDVIPSSPQSQLIENFYEKYFNNDISARGEKTIDINLYDIEVKGLNIPINISYNTCGVKYKQSSGDVGVGWTLSPAARISRTIIGYPDEAMKRVPTLAELEFMNTVQDASPAVNYLFNTNGTYWCAMPYWYYDFGANKRNQFTNNASSQKADGIRCVRDLY